MKRRYLIFPLIAVSFSAFAQKQDSLYSKKKLVKTEVQILLSYYTQNGDHSAVTGGVGTELLHVYSPDLTITRSRDSLHSIQYNMGVDIISSASTDRIDFISSSASRVDSRGYLNIAYNRRIKPPGYTIGGNVGFSIESDYTSLGIGMSLGYINADQSREYSLDLNTYFDDLRWGRLSGQRDLKLVYPSELRNKEWFDIYKRRSYNMSLGLYQTINPRLALEIYPEIIYQHGLLATPFHRVYFTDSSARVENLPENRIKVPFAFQLNVFPGNKIILRTYYRFYWDDFGIVAHTLRLEAPVKISPFFTIEPFVRFYTQTQSKFFKPFHEHLPGESLYTSDYDLSAFTSFNTGLGFRKIPQKQKKLKAVEMKYSFYKRSDELIAHLLSLMFDFSAQKIKNRKRGR